MKRGPWPLPSFAAEDIRNPSGRTYERNEVVDKDHPIWTNGELHPGISIAKNRILGIGREGLHHKKIRAGVLYAASAAAYQANALGYQMQVTSGNRWGVASSPNHGQNGLIGDAIDFVVSTEPGGTGSRAAGAKGMQDTYDILAAGAVAAAKYVEKPGVGIGWGRSNGAGHHVEVDDGQRGTHDASDVWPYSDSGSSAFLTFERDFANGSIFTNPKYAKFKDFTYHAPDPNGVIPVNVAPPASVPVPEEEGSDTIEEGAPPSNTVSPATQNEETFPTDETNQQASSPQNSATPAPPTPPLTTPAAEQNYSAAKKTALLSISSSPTSPPVAAPPIHKANPQASGTRIAGSSSPPPTPKPGPSPESLPNETRAAPQANPPASSPPNAFGPPIIAPADEVVYVAPDKAFSFPLPAGAKIERKAQDAATWVTDAVSSDDKLRVTVLQVELKLDGASPELLKQMLEESSRPYFQGWLEPIKTSAKEVKGDMRVRPIKVDGVDALELSIIYLRGDANDPRTGKAVYIVTPERTIFIGSTVRAGGEAQFERVFQGLRLNLQP
jgi:hypothetical protein